MELPATPRSQASNPLQWVWPLAFAALIFFASSRSRVVGPHFQNSDKLVHFAAYGLLATLICRQWPGWRGAGWALLLASAYGASDEWHQSFVPGRSSDVFDWVADTAGAALGVTLYTGWLRYRTLLEWPIRLAAAKNAP